MDFGEKLIAAGIAIALGGTLVGFSAIDDDIVTGCLAIGLVLTVIGIFLQ